MALGLTRTVHGGAFRIIPLEASVLVLASLALALRWMAAVAVLAFACVGAEVALGGTAEALVNAGGVLALIAVASVSLIGAYRRDALGLGHVRAESVIENIRGQLLVQGSVPNLPAGWHVAVEQRAAHGAAIAGDFVCSRVHDVDGTPHLDLAVVDVSGKGIEAGTRALLLSGAMGGLLGSVGPDEFLSEANDYLRRQAWPEGFASAVYLRIDLSSGCYAVRSAGHPPALHLDAGSGRWRVSDSRGMVLGVRPGLAIRADRQVIGPADMLVLYTDGVVEAPHRDLSWGTDRLMCATEAMIASGTLAQAAQRLVEEVPTRLDDDRAVVVIWRAGSSR